MEVDLLPKLSPLQARLSKKLVGSAENHFAVLKKKTDRFRQHLDLHKDQIIHILADYQSYSTSQDEFQRIFECLDSIEDLRGYFSRKTDVAAVFFPLNMPLYALVLYGVFPALTADRVYIRAPHRMMDLMHRLLPVLVLEQHFANIEVIFTTREQFIDGYVSRADIVIFTGKLVNAQYVLTKTKKNSLFLFNGWGCNPIVVGKDANLEHAAAKTVEARLFSGGQDCAGPDTILVPRVSVDTFVAMLKDKLVNVKVGPFTDFANTVGPMSEDEQIRVIGSIFLKSSEDIVYGGTIDFPTSTIHPTIIVSELSRRMNFEELFAPVLFVSIYEDIDQLRQYFENSLYTANEMYVSLFGQCEYVENLQRSIVVKDQAIFDIDRGNDEFGGYSMGASFVACNRNITPKPILVPRDIWEYLQPGSSGHKLNPNTQKKISKQTRKAMADCFSSNMVFGFVFGSIARGEATGASDINSMIILADTSKEQVEEYTSRLHKIHEQNQLKFRDGTSVVTITKHELNEMVGQLDVSAKMRDGPAYGKGVILIEALSGFQCGVSGDKRLCVEYGRRAMKHSKTIELKMHKKHSKAIPNGTGNRMILSSADIDVSESSRLSDAILNRPLQPVTKEASQPVEYVEENKRMEMPTKSNEDARVGKHPAGQGKTNRIRSLRLKRCIDASKMALKRGLRRAKLWSRSG